MNSKFFTKIPLAVWLAALMLALTSGAAASTHTWTGAGITGNWSLPANWQSGTPPAAGEAAPVVLVFPAGAARLHNTNNIAGLTLHGMTISGNGYAIEGVGAGTNITFSTAVLAFYNFNAANGTLGATLNITLGSTPTFNVGGAVAIAGRLTGAGGLAKSGSGELVLAGPTGNDFTGAVSVNAGTLALNKGTSFFSTWLSAVAVSGPLNIGGTNLAVAPAIVLIHGEQIADTSPLTIQASGTLFLGGNNETIGALTMIGGSLHGDSLETTNVGTLTLGGNVSAPFSPVSTAAISANVALGSIGGVVRTFDIQAPFFNILGLVSDGGVASGLTKGGPGEMRLWHTANTYRGITTINAGSLLVLGSSSLGSTNNGTIINSGAQLVVQGGNLSEALTINGGAANATIHCTANTTLGGPVRLNGSVDIDVDDFAQLTISGAIAGGGGVNKLGAGALLFNGLDANTYTGTTTVQGLLKLSKALGLFPVQSIAGPLVIGAMGTSYTDAHTVRLFVSHQIADPVPVTILDGGNLDLNNRSETIGPLDTQGNIHTGTGVLTLNANVTADTGLAIPGISGTLSLGAQTRTVTVQTGGSLQIFANVIDAPGAVGWIKSGGGALDLFGASAFDGPFTINDGNVWVNHSGALGSAAGPTVVKVGAELNFSDYYGRITNREPIVLSGWGQLGLPEFFGALWSYGTNTLLGPITTQSDTYLFVGSGSAYANGLLTLGGTITGPGKLTQNGDSILLLTGGEDNTHTGGTCVNGGVLLLGKTNGAVAIPSALTANNASVGWQGNNQVGNDVIVTVRGTNGVIDLWDSTDRIGGLVMDAGLAYVNTGLLTLGGDVTVKGSYQHPSTLVGAVSLGGAHRVFNVQTAAQLLVKSSLQDGSGPAGLTVTGGGVASLYQSNSFSGAVIADNALLAVYDDHALGRTNSGVVVTNQGQLYLYNVDVRGKALTLSDWWTTFGGPLRSLFSNSWSGPVHLLANSTVELAFDDSDLVLSGPISGPGGLIAQGFGALHLTGTAPNTFTGLLDVNVPLLELDKTNALAVHGAIWVNYGILRCLASDLIIDTADIFVQEGATFDLNGFRDTIGGLHDNGSFGPSLVELGNGVITVSGAAPVDHFHGVISGAGGELDKAGPNTLVLDGDNTYTSGTLVKGGQLIINGSQPSSDVYVSPGATLGGKGTIGRLFGQGGTISPGNGPGPGRLKVVGDSSFSPATKLLIELDGTIAGTNYDQLNVIGNLAVNDATLQIAMGISGAVGTQYTIIRRSSPMSATMFKNLPEGGTVTANNGATLRISYTGGTGHDVVLTQTALPAPPQFGVITRLGNGQIQLTGSGVPGLLYTIHGNFDLGTTNWVKLGEIAAQPPSGAIEFIDLDATNHAQRFYRFVLP